MSVVASFTFNPFQENTYVVYDDTKECIIFDPGCYTESERQQLVEFITAAELKPVRLINTHCHLDHVFGNQFIADQYKLILEIHRGELPVLESMPAVAQKYGVPQVTPSPAPGAFIETGDVISFGQTKLTALFTPGHSPASLSFLNAEEKYVIAGDVLFQGSIGRTDLPGGNYQTLIESIRTQLLPLDDEVIVYSGHGPETTIGAERSSNPFLAELG